MPAEEDIAEQLVAFLLRCAAAKAKPGNPRLMSELAAKRVLEGLKRSGFVLMKASPQSERQAPAPVIQPYLL